MVKLKPLTLVVGGPTVGHAIYLYFEIMCFCCGYDIGKPMVKLKPLTLVLGGPCNILIV